MSSHLEAELVYIHLSGAHQFHLFHLHVTKALLGFPIPKYYHVHHVDADVSRQSINLTMTNGGGTIDTGHLAHHINSLGIFGEVQVGIYDHQEIDVD